MINLMTILLLSLWYFKYKTIFNQIYFLFVVILTDYNLVNLWCVLLLNYFELAKLSGFNFRLFWFLEVHRY